MVVANHVAFLILVVLNLVISSVFDSSLVDAVEFKLLSNRQLLVGELDRDRRREDRKLRGYSQGEYNLDELDVDVMKNDDVNANDFSRRNLFTVYQSSVSNTGSGDFPPPPRPRLGSSRLPCNLPYPLLCPFIERCDAHRDSAPRQSIEAGKMNRSRIVHRCRQQGTRNTGSQIPVTLPLLPSCRSLDCVGNPRRQATGKEDSKSRVSRRCRSWCKKHSASNNGQVIDGQALAAEPINVLSEFTESTTTSETDTKVQPLHLKRVSVRHRNKREAKYTTRDKSLPPQKPLADSRGLNKSTSKRNPSSSSSSTSSSSPGSRRLGVIVRETTGNLEALVSWDLASIFPGGMRPQGSGAGGTGGSSGDATKTIVVTLHWARETCNYYEGFPRCEVPNVYETQTVTAHSADTKMNVSLHTPLTYNSRYWVEAESDGVTSSRSKFTTRGCDDPLDSFQRCVAPSSVVSSQKHSASSDLDTSDDGRPSFLPNVTCVYHDVTHDFGVADVEWDLHDDDIYVPDGDAMASKDAEVGVGGKDRRLAIWNSTLSVSYHALEGGTVTAKVYRTQQNKFELRLEPDNLYEIQILSTSGDREVVYETVELNTSTDGDTRRISICPATKSLLACESMTADGCGGSWLLLTVSALCLIGLIGLTACVILVTRKFCRGRDKLHLPSHLKKTIMLRANNYKTTPAGSPRQLPKQQTLQLLPRHSWTAADEWELDPNEVTLGEELGQGAFGLVMTGSYQGQQVAIKVIRDDALPDYRKELLREIVLMKQIGHHSNIVRLVGACTIKEPIALIMEFMPHGNLQTFLQEVRRKPELSRTMADCGRVGDSAYSLTATDLLSFARQIAIAMEYLGERRYVHCDLAARNVLVGANKVVKLCDFGLARIVINDDQYQYYKRSNGRLPLKWMAIESIRDRVFTAQSDVWSYGVLLWEIVTFGASPYTNIALVDLFRSLCSGYRLEKPDHCAPELYEIMSQCWHENPTSRATFRNIRERIESLLGESCNYLSLDMFDCRPPVRADLALQNNEPAQPSVHPSRVVHPSIHNDGGGYLSVRNSTAHSQHSAAPRAESNNHSHHALLLTLERSQSCYADCRNFELTIPVEDEFNEMVASQNNC